ncbi:hypothetical protein NMG60_11030095 [Bertholletia excelsa]
MESAPHCDDTVLKRGPWSEEEDEKLVNYISEHGDGEWKKLPKRAGLNRCGKSCRLRWKNYLNPNIARGNISSEEEEIIIRLHEVHGNKWSRIAAELPRRTDNEIKNYWNTHLRRKLLRKGIDPTTHRRISNPNLFTSNTTLPHLPSPSSVSLMNPLENFFSSAIELAKLQLQIQILAQVKNTSSTPKVSNFEGLGFYDLSEEVPMEFSNLGMDRSLSDFPAFGNPLAPCSGGVCQQGNMNVNNFENLNSSSWYQIDQSEGGLPPLVSASGESNINFPACVSTHSPASTNSDSWEKFLLYDDEGSSFLQP